MNKTNKTNKVQKSASYWTSRVNKLVMNQAVEIPGLGRVTNYKAANETYGARRFKISGSKTVRNGANLPLAKVAERIAAVMG